MARFIDRILASHIDSDTSRTLRETEVIVGDNVGEYFYAGTDQEVWHPVKDFPNVAPPFESFFIEFQAPSHIYSVQAGRTEWNEEVRPCAWGLLYSAVDMYSNLSDQFSASTLQRQLLGVVGLEEVLRMHVRSFASNALQKGEDNYEQVYALFSDEQKNIVDQATSLFSQKTLLQSGKWDEACRESLRLRGGDFNARWMVFAQLFTEFRFRSKRVILSPWHWYVPVMPSGRILALGEDPLYYSGPLGEIEQDMLARHRNDAAGLQNELYERSCDVHPFFYASLLTITFLHCKNVSRVQVFPPTRERTVKQVRQGMTSYRQMPYYELDIAPLKTVLRTEGKAEQHGLQKALHICRGHFADYTQGPGLFNRQNGIFWIPQHLRGSVIQGVRDKGYRVSSE